MHTVPQRALDWNLATAFHIMPIYVCSLCSKIWFTMLNAAQHWSKTMTTACPSSTLSFTLTLPSLFVTWRFLNFHNKSHNMKVLFILSHFYHLLVYMENNELLRVSVWPSAVFSHEKTSPRLPMQITWPWPSMSRFRHGLITVRQTKMWT